MGRSVELPEIIPVFPLSGALLLPRSRLPLQVFEPRYLAMLEDCLKTRDRLIGLVQPNPVPASHSEANPALHKIGCVGRIVQFSEVEDGRYMITLLGISRFRIRNEEESGFLPYRRVMADWAGFEQDLGFGEEDKELDRTQLFDILKQFFAKQGLRVDWEALKKADDEMLINALSILCPFEPEDKQALLEAPSLSTRRETLITLIEFSLRSLGGDERLQ